jgi:hypothetical protein
VGAARESLDALLREHRSIAAFAVLERRRDPSDGARTHHAAGDDVASAHGVALESEVQTIGGEVVIRA